MWICCSCRWGENLVHYEEESRHPFGTLQCGCGHIICHSCTASDIIQPFKNRERDPLIFPKTNALYGQVCKGCGLSWCVKSGRHGRHETAPRFRGRVCSCGEESTVAWFRFSLGSNVDHKEGDPNATYKKALNRRLEQAALGQGGNPPPPRIRPPAPPHRPRSAREQADGYFSPSVREERHQLVRNRGPLLEVPRELRRDERRRPVTSASSERVDSLFYY